MSIGMTDRIRREWYLQRLSWHMQDYPSRPFRQIKRDLRRELTVAAGDVGMQQALADVGHPWALAERYTAELDRRLPRWATGATWAGLVVGLIAYLAVAYALGTVDTLEALGGGTVTTYPFGAETTFVNTLDEISVETRFSPVGTLVVVGLAAVAFALGARIWRVFGRA